MAGLIDSTYEIIEQIGSGGGGVVYLARHVRLDKKVVLKADKRKLTAKPEVLRREVDTLKNLSHTYIPQVYDYIVEDDTVYTVMDYIEGESLDKPLKRGEHFKQSQVVEWACELLSALSYMHKRPPHGILHADIKPSNIMLTPQGDIRLIDFNIALMLGEEGAVAVGRSYGYASPEHFGLNYVGSGITQNSLTTDTQKKQTETQMISNTAAISLNDSGQQTGEKKKVVLDVRSDIYSLGATLYHILTGRRPAPSALDVEPIAPEEASPELAAIIMKAMAPDANMRYQTADEMLFDFEHLWQNDPRAKKLKKGRTVVLTAMAVLFLLGAFSTFTGLKRQEQTQRSSALAQQAENVLGSGNREQAVSLALQALPQGKSIFIPPYTPEAEKALADALGVYDLSDGFKAYKSFSQSTETTKLAMSPDGKTIAAVCKGQVNIADTETGKITATLKAAGSALSDAKFLDSDTVVFAGADGITAYSVSQNKTLWTGEPAVKIAVSADGGTVAGIMLDSTSACVYNKDGKLKGKVDLAGKKISAPVNDSLGDPGDAMFALNADGSLLAISFSDGSMTAFDTLGYARNIEIMDPSQSVHYEGGFYGKYLAFSQTGGDGSLFAVIDTAAQQQTGGFQLTSKIGVSADESGIYISNGMTVVRIDPVSGEQKELAYAGSEVVSFVHSGDFTLTASKDGTYSFFDKTAALISTSKFTDSPDLYAALGGGFAAIGSLDKADVTILKLEDHADAQVAGYDPAYKHDEARLNADGTTLMLFSFKGFRLYDMKGKVVSDTSLPDSDQIYDQQYRRDKDGSRLEVTYNDGMVRTYSGDDGKLLSEKQGDKPDLSLAETFNTDKFRIESPLHGAPVVYDKNSGKKVCELQSDDYLTYVTQVGDNIVTEYITDDGSRYGLVLDGECRTIARLPELCDIIDGNLYFDYRSGNIRSTHIYSVDELISAANIIMGEGKK